MYSLLKAAVKDEYSVDTPLICSISQSPALVESEREKRKDYLINQFEE